MTLCHLSLLARFVSAAGLFVCVSLKRWFVVGRNIRGRTFDAREKRLRIKLNDVINIHPLTVNVACPFERVYNIFASFGVRHLVVLGDEAELRGIITRTDVVTQVGGVSGRLHVHNPNFMDNPEMTQLYNRLDTNNDGTISPEEWAAAGARELLAPSDSNVSQLEANIPDIG